MEKENERKKTHTQTPHFKCADLSIPINSTLLNSYILSIGIGLRHRHRCV